MIYFLKATDQKLVKIGYCKYKDLERVKGLSGLIPFDCELILFIDGNVELEKKIHRQFDNDLLTGKREWFKYSKDISDFVKTNASKSEIPTIGFREQRIRRRTDPIGVRFDPDKLEFIKTREKLQSSQQVVDFLINQYWWQWKVPIPTHKEAPPLHLKSETTSVPVHEISKHKASKSFSQYQTEKREIENEDDYRTWLESVESDSNLTTKQKSILKTVV